MIAWSCTHSPKKLHNLSARFAPLQVAIIEEDATARTHSDYVLMGFVQVQRAWDGRCCGTHFSAHFILGIER
jgi:hypothetical protein